MKCIRIILFLLLACFCLAASIFINQTSAAEDWKPIDSADLSSKTPVVDKDADAEGLFWEVRVDDGDAAELVFTNYVRVKVFTDRGKESQSKIDLTYFSGSNIKDIAARTIKPDGTIINLKKEDVYERTIVKASGAKLKAKSFAMPSIEPGAIIEYRWREIRYGSADYVDLQLQRDIPVRRITYLVRPFSGAQGMSYLKFRVPNDVKFEKAKDGFSVITLNNVAGFREEPRMPPEDTVRSWILLYYTNDNQKNPEKFWVDFGKQYNDLVKDKMKVNDDLKREAARIIGNATDPQEKLRRLYEFCQTQIKNINYEAASGMSQQERDKFDTDKSAVDTLKKRTGNGSHIDYLFAALAAAAGFESHLALSGNREYQFLDKAIPDSYFLLNRGSSFVAVRVGDKWQFMSPAERYTPFGMLGWREEGQSALIIQKDPVWADVPLSPPEKTLQKRSGKLRLLEDGTLEGDITIEYSGQFGIGQKASNDDESPEAREKALTDDIKERISNAELTNIKIENVLDPTKPYVCSYHIKVPGYAQKTGKRLFFQPGFFVFGEGPMFKSATRVQPVFFQYAWSEEDHLTFELPAGFDLDNADAPAPVKPESTGNICGHEIKMNINRSDRILNYERKFFFGGRGYVLFPELKYTTLKSLFDLISKSDDHTITLKQSVAASN
jgi:hypothetical protein